MTSTRVLAILALVAPLSAAAQVSYCMDRNDALWERKADLDASHRAIDREGARLDRMKARLDDEFARLDWTDRVAVAAYNDRSSEYNRQSDLHNRRVARMNGAAADLNADSSDLAAECNGAVIRRY